MSIEKQQLAFGDTLRRLREQAGFATGKEFAQRLNWLPSKVSRVENGKTVPTDSDVIAWLDGAKVPDLCAAELRNELRELRVARSTWKRRMRSGQAPPQRTIAELERRAARITMVEFHVVPVLVQTPEYARAVLAATATAREPQRDTEQAIRTRIRRQDVLYDPTKRIEVVVAEAALRYPVCSAPVLVAQIDRLISLSGFSNMSLAVIPLATRLPVVTMHGFTLMDDVALIGLNHTEITVSDSDDVALYGQLAERLRSVAVDGDECRALLARISADVAEGEQAEERDRPKLDV